MLKRLVWSATRLERQFADGCAGGRAGVRGAGEQAGGEAGGQAGKLTNEETCRPTVRSSDSHEVGLANQTRALYNNA